MTTTGNEMGSILLGSRDPDRLASWYTAAFSPTRIQDRIYDFGGVTILFESRDDVGAATAEPGRHILNFTVVDAHESAERLNALGVTWLVPVEERGDTGWFGTLVDPDGNYVQIIEFKPEYLAS